MEELIIGFLKKDTDKFNIKTVNLQNFKEVIKNSPLFTTNLEFMPPEFHLVLKFYKDYPDPFVKFYKLHEYRIQNYKNMLALPGSLHYYELFYRNVFTKTNSCRISLIYASTNSPEQFFVAKNFDGKLEPDKFLTFEQAFTLFYTTNI